jgi:hypothetical protein
VRPPDFAVAAAHAASYDLSWLDRGNQADAKLVCESEICCEEVPGPAVHSCCSKKKHTPAERTVIAWQALQCGGQSMNWLAAVPTLVNVGSDLVFDVAPPTWFSPPVSDSAHDTAALPAVPPPERA